MPRHIMVVGSLDGENNTGIVVSHRGCEAHLCDFGKHSANVEMAIEPLCAILSTMKEKIDFKNIHPDLKPIAGKLDAAIAIMKEIDTCFVKWRNTKQAQVV